MDTCAANTTSIFMKDVQCLCPPNRLSGWEYSRDDGSVFVNTVERSLGGLSGQPVKLAAKKKTCLLQRLTHRNVKEQTAAFPLHNPKEEQEGSLWSWRRGPGRLITPEDVGPEGAAKKMVVQY